MSYNKEEHRREIREFNFKLGIARTGLYYLDNSIDLDNLSSHATVDLWEEKGRPLDTEWTLNEVSSQIKKLREELTEVKRLKEGLFKFTNLQLKAPIKFKLFKKDTWGGYKESEFSTSPELHDVLVNTCDIRVKEIEEDIEMVKNIFNYSNGVINSLR